MDVARRCNKNVFVGIEIYPLNVNIEYLCAAVKPASFQEEFMTLLSHSHSPLAHTNVVGVKSYLVQV